MERAGFDPQSHSGKALMHVLEHFPRDELFQIDAEQLSEMAVGIVSLHERQRIALFLRHDPFGRFVSAFVYVPRERYNAALRRTFEGILANAFNGSVLNHVAQFGDEPLGRIHFVIATRPGAVPDYDVREIEAKLRDAGRTWSDRLKEALLDQHGEEAGNRLYRRYGDAFPVGYQAHMPAASAVLDIDKMEGAVADGELAMNLYRPLEADEHELQFKVYNTGEPLSLSDVLPVLENMDLKVLSEIPFEIEPRGLDRTFWIHDFKLVTSDGSPVDFEQVHDHFQEGFRRVWRGDMENDGFNRLILEAGLDWRDVVVLRAFYKYLRQARIPFSQEYVEQTLARNPALATSIVELFHIRFDPGFTGKRQVEEIQVTEKILEGLDAVSNLDEDRIIRRYLNLTQRRCARISTSRRKMASRTRTSPSSSTRKNIEELPLPRPFREIFVYSPRVEGVHLRFGSVARGGLRWSDRREDFRTEVLGLVKAQQVKNAVIVPVGSKGGFVLKKPPPRPAARPISRKGSPSTRCSSPACWTSPTIWRATRSCRRSTSCATTVTIPIWSSRRTRARRPSPTSPTASRGTMASGSTMPSPPAVRPATTTRRWASPRAAPGNRSSATSARSARISRPRISPSSAVGDMSGDVFGNGMLLSEHIRLIGAFNHMHIFIDPIPDAAKSLQERQRLFDLPRSSWATTTRS